jgi:hypothetical protein
MLAGRALNLKAGELHFTLKMLFAARALKFEFSGWHNERMFGYR